MHEHRTPEGLKEHALLDRAVLNLMLDSERERPWAEDELARTLNVPGDVRESLRRLRACKLIHRWNDLAVAAHTAVRFYEITRRAENLTRRRSRGRHEQAVLEGLLARAAEGEGPRSQQQTFDAFGAPKRKQRLAVTDALDRLEGAGLIERRAGRSIASEVALRLDELMTVSRASRFPHMRVNELALSQAFLPSLAKAGIHTVEQLAEHDLGELLRQPEFRSGVELYELIRELHRHGLTPFAARGGHVQTEREQEMFRLRAVEGLTLAQIGDAVRHHGRAGARTAQTALRPQRHTARRKETTPGTAPDTDNQRTAPHVPACAADGHAQLPPALDPGGSRRGASPAPRGSYSAPTPSSASYLPR